MKHYVAIGEASVRLGICQTPIRGWDREGHIQCYRTPGGQCRISLIELERILNEGFTEEHERTGETKTLDDSKTAIYARVPSHDQKKKDDLDRQIKTVLEYY